MTHAIEPKLIRNLDTPESREFWRRVQEAAKETAKWPAWKRALWGGSDEGVMTNGYG